MSHKTETKKARPLLCVVTSDKMSKSRVGVVDRTVKHAEYGKYIKRRTKMMFHDENNETKIGDSVLIIPAKPRSASKRFDLLKVVKKAEA